MAQRDIPVSNQARGPFTPDTTGNGDFFLNRALLKHDLDSKFTRHVIQVFGWDVDADGSNNDLTCDIALLGPAGEIPQSTDDGYTTMGQLVSTAGNPTSPNTSGSHTIILDVQANGPIIETVAGGIGLTTLRYPAKSMRLRFRAGGTGAWSTVAEAKRALVHVYIKSITVFSV